MIKYRLWLKARSTILIFTGCALLFTSFGCEAFVRKFTRKSKKEETVEMVLAPEEYKNPLTKEELYKKYLLFWKSWQDELITSLIEKRSQKKILDCADESIKNLNNMRELLKENRYKRIDFYIRQMWNLRDALSDDIYSNNLGTNMERAETIKRGVLRDFAFQKVKNDIVK